MTSKPAASAPITGLDHVILAARDLEAGRAQLGRLGFNTTPRGRHVGWGTANYCVMLEQDYIELLGIVDASRFTNHLDRFLERHEGVLGLALGTDDAAATERAWRTAGIASAERRALGRLLESGAEPIELCFDNVMIEKGELAGLSLFACHHLTPAPMRRPAWLRHPNTARRIKSVTVLTQAVEALAAAAGRLLGASALTWTDEIAAAHTGGAVMLMAEPADAVMLHPAFDLDEPDRDPCIAVLELAVADADAAARFLDLHGVAWTRQPGGGIAIQPEDALGVGIELTPER